MSSNCWDPLLDDSDAMELGMSTEIMREDLYLPSHITRGWIRCCITLSGDDGYRLYLEKSMRFLLCARRNDYDNFLISTHEDFPSFLLENPKRGFVAKLKRQRDSTFELALKNCRLCDNILGSFTCGRGPEQREVLAKIFHSVRRFNIADVDLRCMLVTIPQVHESGARTLWCPRSLRTANPSLPMSADVCDAVAITPSVGVRCVNKLPEWSPDLESLVLKFQGNRILSASAKNFLLFEENLQGYRKNYSNSEEGGSEDAAILQFGKSSPTQFILDFKHPLSPLQAFGIAISSFMFSSDDAVNSKKMSDLPSNLVEINIPNSSLPSTSVNSNMFLNGNSSTLPLSSPSPTAAALRRKSRAESRNQAFSK